MLIRLLMRIKLLLALLVVLCIQASAQFRAMTFCTKVASKMALLEQAPEVITFCFPRKEVCAGIVVDKKNSVLGKIERDALAQFDWNPTHGAAWTQSLRSVVSIPKDAARLSLTVYAENVRRILIVFRSNNDAWIVKEFKIESQGYQMPVNSYLLSWDQSEHYQGGFSTFELSGVTVVYEPCDLQKPAKAILGNLTIEEYYNHLPGNVLSWLDSLSGNYHSNVRMFDEYSQWSLAQLAQKEIASFETFGVKRGYLSGIVEFKADGDNVDERVFFQRFLLRLLEKYPFYEDKNINKSAVFQAVRNVFEQHRNDEREQLYLAMKRVVDATLQDPHFTIALPGENTRSKKIPLAIKEVAGDPVIAAVYSAMVESLVKVGSRVISVDGTRAMTNNLDELFSKAGDTLHLTLEDPADQGIVRSVKIPTKVNITIDQRFIAKHGEVKMLLDSVAYVKLNNWTGDSYYTFLNNRLFLSSSRGLVIDLRGNGGGVASDMFLSLSLFVKNTTALGIMEYPWCNESMTVSPARKEFAFPQSLPIAILVDGMTACASEMFIMGMKGRSNTVVVGDGPTRGAIASPTLYRFPSGVIVRAHTNIRRYSFQTFGYVEGKGLSPDILISRTHARDLKPYEDKVLRTAVVAVLPNYTY